MVASIGEISGSGTDASIEQLESLDKWSAASFLEVPCCHDQV
jgi:hypothetical protein